MTPQEEKMMASVSSMKISSLKPITPDWEFEGKHYTAKVFRRPDSLYVQLFSEEDLKKVEEILKPLGLDYEVVPEIPAIAASFPSMDDPELQDVLEGMDEKLEIRSGS